MRILELPEQARQKVERCEKRDEAKAGQEWSLAVVHFYGLLWTSMDGAKRKLAVIASRTEVRYRALNVRELGMANQSALFHRAWL